MSYGEVAALATGPGMAAYSKLCRPTVLVSDTLLAGRRSSAFSLEMVFAGPGGTVSWAFLNRSGLRPSARFHALLTNRKRSSAGFSVALGNSARG